MQVVLQMVVKTKLRTSRVSGDMRLEIMRFFFVAKLANQVGNFLTRVM